MKDELSRVSFFSRLIWTPLLVLYAAWIFVCAALFYLFAGKRRILHLIVGILTVLQAETEGEIEQ